LQAPDARQRPQILADLRRVYVHATDDFRPRLRRRQFHSFQPNGAQTELRNLDFHIQSSQTHGARLSPAAARSITPPPFSSGGWNAVSAS